MGKLTVRFNFADILFCISMIFVAAFPNPSVFKALAIILFFADTIFLSIASKRNTKNLLQYIWWILFFAFCNLSKIWSAYPQAADEIFTNIIWSALLSIAIVNYISLYNLSVVDIAKRMLIIAVAFFVDVILNGEYIDDRYTVVIDGYVLNENVFGQIALSLSCYLLYWNKKRNWKSMSINICVLILIVLALLSGSRKTLVSLAVFIILIIFYEYPPKSIVKAFVKILGIALVLGLLYWCIMSIEALYLAIGIRIEELLDFIGGNQTADGSADTRVQMIETATQMFKNKPFLGYGLNTFSYLTTFGAYAHNNYLELLANIGLTGCLLYYIPLFIYFFKALSNWKNSCKDSVIPLAVIGIFLANDFAMVSYSAMVSHAFLALAIGLCVNTNNETHNLA